MAKKTPWFPASAKPARRGVYETKQPDGDRYFNLFDGERWHWGWESPDDAGDEPMTRQSEREFVCAWRGLAKEPK